MSSSSKKLPLLVLAFTFASMASAHPLENVAFSPRTLEESHHAPQ
jgi:hypothetical protein